MTRPQETVREMNSALKEARIAAGMSQQGMSDAMGIPKRTIQDWERGLRVCPPYVERLVVAELARLAASVADGEA